MGEELTQSIGCRISEIENIFLTMHVKKLGKSMSEFLRETIINAIPKCQICQSQFAVVVIQHPRGATLSCCNRCASQEASVRGSRIVEDFFQDSIK